jgi:hypothetical protein
MLSVGGKCPLILQVDTYGMMGGFHGSSSSILFTG